MKVPFHFQFPVERFIGVDGDTVHVVLDQGMGVFRETALRIIGIDTPELRDPVQHAAAVVAAAALKHAIEVLGSHGGLTCETFRADKFGDRWDGDLFDRYGTEGRRVSSVMLAEGFAKSYVGGKRSWTAEELAAIVNKCIG